MKVQNFYEHSLDSEQPMLNVIPCQRSLTYALLKDFSKIRMNGDEKFKLPMDGTHTFTEGRVDKIGEFTQGTVYGVKKEDGKYRYTIRYDFGHCDRDKIEKADRKYLAKLLEDGTLMEKEPAVWYLREMDGAQKRDIGDWWHEKLQLPNLDEILANAEKTCQIGKQQEQAAGAPAASATPGQQQTQPSKLQSKLQTLCSVTKNIVAQIQTAKQSTLLTEENKTALKRLIDYVSSLNPDSLDEENTAKAIAYIESWKSYLSHLYEKTDSPATKSTGTAATTTEKQTHAIVQQGSVTTRAPVAAAAASATPSVIPAIPAKNPDRPIPPTPSRKGSTPAAASGSIGNHATLFAGQPRTDKKSPAPQPAASSATAQTP